MAFLDNSGDIILDAVLTDTGRMRLAKGDGTFRISKFALGDDEINYGSYNKSHPSGSAYFDLEVLQTPVLEALTNNTSTLNSKIISIPRTNLLYLPVIKLATQRAGSQPTQDDNHVVAVDDNTVTALTVDPATGVLNGVRPGATENRIEAHQGLDTLEIPWTFTIDSDLYETQYIIEIDNRLGQIYKPDGTSTKVSFVDDDNIASYYLSAGTDGTVVQPVDATGDSDGNESTSPIQGPRGSKILFKIKASVELSTSTFLFTQLGSTKTGMAGDPTNTYYFIDTTVRVTGATTGYRLDIPVRFAKKQT